MKVRLLIVSATAAEASGLISDVESELSDGSCISLDNNHFDIDLLVTGVGSIATAYYVGRQLLGKQYDLAINIGLAGSFRDDWLPGKVVEVASDCFADLGAEDHDNFLDIFEMGFADKNKFPFNNGKLSPLPHTIIIPSLEKARAMTVNSVHGNENSISKVQSRIPADVESMEGAAFFFACNFEKLPSLQIRAISNRVEPRNRENWEIKKALDALTAVVRQMLN